MADRAYKIHFKNGNFFDVKSSKVYDHDGCFVHFYHTVTPDTSRQSTWYDEVYLSYDIQSINCIILVTP